MPRVSVIIPTYNRESYVAEAIDCALGQTFRDLEVIVVDDGSTDGTRTVLERYGDRIRLLYQENAGSASARNAGIKIASGEYIAFLDSDCLWAPEKIELQVEHFDEYPENAMVYTLHLPLSAAGRITRRKPKRRSYHSGRIFEKLYNESNFVLNPAVMIRREALDAVGLFDETFRIAQCAELYLRVSHRYGVGLIKRPLTFYRHHPEQISSRQEEKIRYQRMTYKKAYRLFADREPRVTPEMYQRRMADLDFKLARLYLRGGRVREARRLLRSAWRVRRGDWRLLRYLVASAFKEDLHA